MGGRSKISVRLTSRHLQVPWQMHQQYNSYFLANLIGLPADVIISMRRVEGQHGGSENWSLEPRSQISDPSMLKQRLEPCEDAPPPRTLGIGMGSLSKPQLLMMMSKPKEPWSTRHDWVMTDTYNDCCVFKEWISDEIIQEGPDHSGCDSGQGSMQKHITPLWMPRYPYFVTSLSGKMVTDCRFCVLKSWATLTNCQDLPDGYNFFSGTIVWGWEICNDVFGGIEVS